ncbi:flagellar biosynthesis protein FlhB [Pseudorhodoplanes sinuspersici]|uniref:Flagellar biosynthetic protein FlhB n=1 Tax=Pseudorhodoplanes sinuspersici TaxID=1235591 RepID=A0A1W6ZTT3_9HYPH|nr:flagellar biosynthesis protein FlhB [Pseudorhodoplanes sinuspersici]ARQ00819.1 flagellar biosynthesis protein FlhB [Pseudorhodoplanes sinuspersici]RKE72436.1 flagellar biosynthetic protein FlhB [Pseudorhodoplanes sinuspersici]
MAEQSEDNEKTEDPTQKRLDEALERGDVAKSQEVSTWFVLAGATLMLLTFGNQMASGLKTTLGGLISNAHRIPTDGTALILLSGRIGKEVIAAVAIPILLVALFAIGGNMIQHRLVWSTQSLTPKLSKISPAAGFKRLFSKIALVNFAKGIAKIAILGTVMTMLLWPERTRLEGLVTLDVAAILPFTAVFALKMLGFVVIIMAFIAGADYFFQYRQWYEKQKMSLQEIKEEFKQTDGDPQIKARIRRIRESRMRKRMMAAVPEASVVVMNPTHYAVALKYERGDNAPLCVAKGLDNIALKIREVAEAHGVPVVENPPLARALHATVDVDQEIPAEHYRAVAEVIGYVMRLRRRLN